MDGPSPTAALDVQSQAIRLNEWIEASTGIHLPHGDFAFSAIFMVIVYEVIAKVSM
jgi:hypothetical protein